MPRLKLSWILQSGTEHHQSPVQHFAVNRTIWNRETVITLIGSTREGSPKTAAFLVPAQSHRERACTQVLAACMPWTLRCHEKSTFSSVALYLTQTSHKIQAPFALRKISCWTLHLAVASRNGFESMKSEVFKDIGVAAWSTRIRSSKAAPAPWHKAHKIFRKPGSKWNLLCRIQWTELSSALRSAPRFMIKLVPSWPEANRTRRSKSEPGRNQASTNPTQRRSRGNGEAFRLFDGLLLDVLGVSNRAKCMQMEIHRKTFKKIISQHSTLHQNHYLLWDLPECLGSWQKVTSSAEKVSCQSISSSDQRWASGAARKKTASCCLPMKPGKADNEAAPMLHQMNLLKSSSWGHVGHFLTRLTKETRAMELMTLKKHKDATCQRDAVCTTPCQWSNKLIMYQI